MRPLVPRQKRRLSNDAAVHLKQLQLLRGLKKKEWRHQQGVELAEAGRERRTPIHRQSQSTRCQNSSSRMMKGQRDRLTCRGESGERSKGKRKGAAVVKLVVALAYE